MLAGVKVEEEVWVKSQRGSMRESCDDSVRYFNVVWITLSYI